MRCGAGKRVFAAAAFWDACPFSPDDFAAVKSRLIRTDKDDPASNEEAFAHLSVSVKDSDAAKVGRAFSGKAVEMALASYPGFTITGPPILESQFAVYCPTLITAQEVEHRVSIGGECIPIPPTAVPADLAGVPNPPGSGLAAFAAEPTRALALGTIRHPGGLQWYRLATHGTYDVKLAMSGSSANDALSLYAASDISRPLAPLASGNGARTLRYRLPEDAFIRIGKARSDLSGAFALRVTPTP